MKQKPFPDYLWQSQDSTFPLICSKNIGSADTEILWFYFKFSPLTIGPSKPEWIAHILVSTSYFRSCLKKNRKVITVMSEKCYIYSIKCQGIDGVIRNKAGICKIVPVNGKILREKLF